MPAAGPTRPMPPNIPSNEKQAKHRRADVLVRSKLEDVAQVKISTARLRLISGPRLGFFISADEPSARRCPDFHVRPNSSWGPGAEPTGKSAIRQVGKPALRWRWNFLLLVALGELLFFPAPVRS